MHPLENNGSAQATSETHHRTLRRSRNRGARRSSRASFRAVMGDGNAVMLKHARERKEGTEHFMETLVG
ncbi:MAG: hypothetical protein N2C14_05630 [Planctomycetales bacterium]